MEIYTATLIIKKHLEWQNDKRNLPKVNEQKLAEATELLREIVKQLTIPVVSFELPSDDIFDKLEVNLKNPLEEFYYYERPAYFKDDQKQFKARLQKALNYLKGN